MPMRYFVSNKFDANPSQYPSRKLPYIAKYQPVVSAGGGD